MQATTADTAHGPEPLPHTAPASPPTTAPADDKLQGGSVIAATVEPPPHESTKVEVTQLKDPEIRDFGWNSQPRDVPAPLIHGTPNDDLFTLIRRFNKQIFHVKTVDNSDVPGLLDLEVSENEEFSPDKLRATLERFYMTVIIGLAAFGKHIARLRSWNEPRRTVWFCLGYYVAWWFNVLLPVLSLFMMILILDPPSRKILFPPAPLALISATTGNIQKPKAGTLNSKDSLSGASEAHKGEAVEQEARHFVSGLASVAISTAAGKGPGDDGDGNAVGGGEAEAESVDKPASSIEGAMPDPIGVVAGATEAKDLASGDNAAADPAKQPVESAMWNKARPIMRLISDAADGWERLGNALSPTHPFPCWVPRLKLAGPMLPIAFATYFVNMAFVLRIITFLVGFGFFAQPVIVRGAVWLTCKVPNWREYLELRRSLLAGVPTNAQLTLTLLRIAEKNKAPIPPPPTSLDPTYSDSEDETDSFDGSAYDVDTDSEDYGQDSRQDRADASNEGENSASPKRTPGRKIAAAFKRTVKASVGGALGVDHIKAKIGSEQAKQRVGAVSEPPPSATMPEASGSNSGAPAPAAAPQSEVARVNLPGGEGPCVFSARLHGKKGHILLVTSATSPCIAFAYTKLQRSVLASLLPGRHDKPEEAEVDIRPEFSMGLSDVAEIRKMGGFGWKGKILVGWATGREILDGLELVDRQGKKVVLTAIKGRDELFNRVLSMGEHKWECL